MREHQIPQAYRVSGSLSTSIYETPNWVIPATRSPTTRTGGGAKPAPIARYYFEPSQFPTCRSENGAAPTMDESGRARGVSREPRPHWRGKASSCRTWWPTTTGQGLLDAREYAKSYPTKMPQKPLPKLWTNSSRRSGSRESVAAYMEDRINGLVNTELLWNVDADQLRLFSTVIAAPLVF